MFILLPPSEGKTPPTKGPALALDQLSFSTLASTREMVLTELMTWCRQAPTKAQHGLGLSDRLSAQVTRNSTLTTIPCAPAVQVYTGVLYDALDWSSLNCAQRRRGQRYVAIASALFGLLRPLDVIPAYRLSGGTRLPHLGGLKTAWKLPLAETLIEAIGEGPIIDMRSAAYSTLGPIPATLADRCAAVRVLAQRGGKKVVVSHHNKATKGLLTRALLQDSAPTTISDAAGILGALGHHVELNPPVRSGQPWSLDVITAM